LCLWGGGGGRSERVVSSKITESVARGLLLLLLLLLLHRWGRGGAKIPEDIVAWWTTPRGERGHRWRRVLWCRIIHEV